MRHRVALEYLACSLLTTGVLLNVKSRRWRDGGCSAKADGNSLWMNFCFVPKAEVGGLGKQTLRNV